MRSSTARGRIRSRWRWCERRTLPATGPYCVYKITASGSRVGRCDRCSIGSTVVATSHAKSGEWASGSRACATLSSNMAAKSASKARRASAAHSRCTSRCSRLSAIGTRTPPAWVAPLLPGRVCRPGKPAAILMSRQVTGGSRTSPCTGVHMPPGSSREGRSAETSSPQCSASAGVLNAPPTPSRSLQHIGLGVGELFEAAPDALVTIDGDGEIALANAQVEHLFGYGRHELVGRPIEVLMPERFWQSHVGHRARYAATPVVRPMGTGLRLVCRRKDGTEFWAEISLSPIATAAGLVVTCAIRDVTERLNGEDERAALLAREQSARDAAAVRARDEFLCVAAHELKTPVTSLRGYAQLLLRQLRTQGVLDVKLTTRALNVIDQSSGRLDELVSRLLDVSRIQAGKLALDPRETDVVPLVWRTVDAAQLRTTEHHLKVRAPASRWASIDPLRFEQVL